jgi:catechol 2,3-dioxygenase-like lactoylglutathione lyase family enzyme
MSNTAPVREPLLNKADPLFPRIMGLHHAAYRCRNAEETRHFYEDILRLPLVAIVEHEHVPSTGEYCPYFHLFFEMGDGSMLAFFDLYNGVATQPDPATPAWVNHIALQVADAQSLLDAKARLEGAGVEVLGPTNHEAIRSIYFFDPNGIRVELTCFTIDRERLLARAARARATMASYPELASRVQQQRQRMDGGHS